MSILPIYEKTQADKSCGHTRKKILFFSTEDVIPDVISHLISAVIDTAHKTFRKRQSQAAAFKVYLSI